MEATSSSFSDLITAVNYASNQAGVSVVSMSWGSGEYSGETSYDQFFTTPSGHNGGTFVASTGDTGSNGAPETPSVSPNVLAVGGTQLTTGGTGNYLGETGWGGGGVSAYESQPSYQKGVVTQTSTMRAVPDVAYDGSSGSPFAVYDTSSYGGWIQVYGTSAGAPQWAALIAVADQGLALSGKGSLDGDTQTLPDLYKLPGNDFHDITSGSNGAYSAGKLCTFIADHRRKSLFDGRWIDVTPYSLVRQTNKCAKPSWDGTRPGHRTGQPICEPNHQRFGRIKESATAALRASAGRFRGPGRGDGGAAYVYNPTGSAWTFSGQSGVAGNGSGFTSANPNAPEGVQVAFLQNQGSFSQTATLSAGNYTLSFLAAQRGNYQASSQTFQVLVDGAVVGTFKPSGTGYASYSTGAFTVAAGGHTITFQVLDPNGDNTALIDQVQLTGPNAVLSGLFYDAKGATGLAGVAKRGVSGTGPNACSRRVVSTGGPGRLAVDQKARRTKTCCWKAWPISSGLTGLHRHFVSGAPSWHALRIRRWYTSGAARINKK